MLGETFTVVDDPEHTLTFLDWQDDAVEVTLQTNSEVSPLIRNLIGNPDTNFANSEPPAFRLGPDRTIVSRIPFDAGLINGLGKTADVLYRNSRLSIII